MGIVALILLVVAFVLFVLHSVGGNTNKFDLQSLGLASFALAVVIGNIALIGG